MTSPGQVSSKRVALVIGNGAYDSLPALKNPKNDASEVSTTLTKMGFDVDCKIDLTIDQIDVCIGEFKTKVTGAEVALFFFAGHGVHFEKQNYLLPIEAKARENLERHALSLATVLDVMKEHARYSLVFLDACRRNFISSPNLGATRSVVAETKGPTEARPAKKNIFIAFATSHGQDGFDGVGNHSPFTDALLKHIATPDISIGDMMGNVIQSVLTATNEYQIPTLESTMGPFCLVDSTLSKPPPAAPAQSDKYAPLDAFRQETFEKNPSALHCVIVTAELPSSQAVAIDRHVRLAIEHHRNQIKDAAADLKARRFSGDDQKNPAVGAEQNQVVRSRLDSSRAFAGPDELRAAVRALCRADIAVFDITQLQPGVMILLGIRAVARRGVTICSYGDDYVHGQGLQLPFNLQMLNVAAHSERQTRSAKSPPSQLIGRKIVQGLKELATLPDYMDLPAYDPVRTLGPSVENFTPISLRDKVLILCPFSPRYEDHNWRVLKEELFGKLMMRRAESAPSEVDDVSWATEDQPLLIRLLDEESPRLVVQTLYELIRRVDMCVVDWTRLRPNVMFELGVRLAVNRLGAVHIVDSDDATSEDLTDADKARIRLPHATQLKRLFHIISYSSNNPEAEPFEKMVDWFSAGYRASLADDQYRNQRLMDFLIYESIGEHSGGDSDGLFLPIADELIERANLLANKDEESIGSSSILYRDANRALWTQAQFAAAERRIAACLYIDACYADDEIVSNRGLYQKFRSLGAQVRRWFNTERENSNGELSASRQRIEARIKERMRGLQPRS